MTVAPLVMVDRPATKLRVLVPRRDNAGREFPPEYFGSFEHFAVRRADGFTREGVAYGEWVSPDHVTFHDESIPYVIVCAPERAREIAQALNTLLRVLFEQQASFIEISDVRTSEF